MRGETTDPLHRFFGTAVALMIADNGVWEKADRFHVGDASGVEAVRHRLDRAGEDVAIEVGFDTDAFVGLRLRPAERNQAKELVTTLLTQPAGVPLTAGEVMSMVDRLAATRFAHVEADHAELGVLDRWQSLGHIKFDLPLVDVNPLRLNPAGFDLHDAPAPIMLEIVFGPKADGWIAARVSTQRGPHMHKFDAFRFRAFAEAVCMSLPIPHPGECAPRDSRGGK
ncbi:hypothetical protein [Nonomuraea sp. NPDC050202]|uniref:hypothetical protein n=1 Tax=Nonomuraea sp. NPDC050202 TaxID=3155035 RepID=UPI0033EABBA8